MRNGYSTRNLTKRACFDVNCKKYTFDIKRTSKELYNVSVLDLVLRGDQSPPSLPLKVLQGQHELQALFGPKFPADRALQKKLYQLKEVMLGAWFDYYR
ncbi:E3 ubiquitin-protein ligase MYLIP [Tupaia chinensis]|uniref:E3 ubiquitin-protein ligase MYLIP n=1 Tax=Tupaia chinensis TaxID=246437 RepID=L9KRV5_TUPCH|nr:E3 ubiquitin-protein ligase MYLIP [Tupaia chinensis]